MCIRDRNDIGPHGFIEGKYNEGKLSISFVPWACREYIPLELDTKECPTNLAFQETVRMRMAAKGMQHKMCIRDRDTPLK